MKEILDILMSDIWTLSETEEEKKRKKEIRGNKKLTIDQIESEQLEIFKIPI